MAKISCSLREFLQVLEEEEMLLRVTEEVSPEPDIGAAGRAAANSAWKPAVYFEKIKGYTTPVVTNVHGSWKSHALMLGMDKDTPVKEQFFELNRRWDKYPVEPVIVKREEAPCKENIITENIDLPISIRKITRTPYKLQKTVYTKKQAENKAATQLKRYQKQLLEREIQIVDSDVSTIIDGVSCVTKGTLTVDEVCGKRQPAAPDPTPK